MTATYAVHESVATITLDDGKVNALSPAMQAAINTAFDQAAAEVAAGTVKAVVLAGNGRVFSAGFELSVFASGDADAGYGMLRGGFELALRVLTFPAPVVMASTGPAIAMGSFLMLTGDHRVGSVKSRFQANEVAIGMVIPQAALEIMRMRLTPPAYSRAVSVAAVFAGDAAIVANLLTARKHLGLMLPAPVQAAMAVALGDDAHVEQQKERYRTRRDILRPAVEAAGFRIDHSEGGLYLWATRGEDAWQSLDVLADLGILAGPGHFYGEHHPQHVRFSLTATDERIAEAARRLSASS